MKFWIAGESCLIDDGARGNAYLWRLVVAVLLLTATATAAAVEAGTFKSGAYEYSVAPAAAWVHPHDIAPVWDASAPGAKGGRWRYWLIDTQVDRRRGARVRFYDRAFEPISSELVQDAGKYQIWFSPDYQKLTLHRVEVRRDGKWSDRLVPKAITLARRESEFERDMSDGLVSALIVLDDVRPADVVRVSYSIAGDNPVLAGLVGESLTYAGNDPILDRYSRILFDATAKIAERRDGSAPQSTQHRIDDAFQWDANGHGIAALIDEGSYPVWYSPVPTIDVAESRSWSEVAAWARTLYPTPKPLPADLEQRIADWNKLETPDLRITMALRAVQEEIRYFGTEMGESTHRPSEPAETWARRYGDCKDKARLLATVLQRLGVDAHPALVSAARGKSVAELPPSASAFDHVIVEARLRDQIVWLDATATQQRGSPLQRPAGEFGVALPIAAGADGLVTVASPKTAVDRVQVVEHLQPSGTDKNVAFSVESEYAGAAADRMRRRMKSVAGDKFERDYLDFYRRRYGEVSKAAEWDVQDDEQENKLRITEHYLLKNPWLGNAVGKRSMDIYADALGNVVTVPKTGERVAPMAISYPYEVKQQTSLELPEGWSLLSDSTSHELDDVATRYELKTIQSKRTITVTQSLSTSRDAVEPRDYAKHFSLLREANDLLGRRLVLSMGSKDAEGERDKRLEKLMRNILDESHDKPAHGGG